MRIVSFNVSHDSSVCSYVDGEIEFYCKEERLSRVKRDKFPFKSLDLYYEQDFGPIDHFLYLTPSNNNLTEFEICRIYIKKKFGIELENYSSLNHHECHASLAFYNSGFSEALIVVVDRNGSIYFRDGQSLCRECESVYGASYSNDFIPLYKNFWDYQIDSKEIVEGLLDRTYDCDVKCASPYSIVKVYEAVTTLIGENPIENGKTMGLAPYGKDMDYPSLFIDGCGISNYFSCQNDSTCFYQEEIIDSLTEENYQFYADKAKHVQIETQKEVLKLIKRYVEETNVKKVCVVGGYGLNVVANNYYIKNLPDVDFYFEPMADDSGITIGASMLKYRKETRDDALYEVDDNFYHFYDERVPPGKEATSQDIVNQLKDQKIVALFEGAPEAGPRALGHRSLLFDPRNKDGKDIVNTLKNREWYRPFAGVILEEHFPKYFKTLGLTESEYMTINFECKGKTVGYVPAIVHVDNTCRIQTVNDGVLFDLLSLFYKQTGCPMLLNTSFNLAGDPLVHSVDDALEFIEKTKNNSVFAGVYFVDKEQEEGYTFKRIS